jgi:putative isomerase
LRCNVAVQHGTPCLSAPWNGLSANCITLDLLPEAGSLSATLDLFRIAATARPIVPQEQAQASIAAEFAAFLEQMPQVPAAFAAGRLLACYILWANAVPAEGALSLPSIYMSKNWMNNIWSWDHCFVALAFASARPDRAFEQMAAIFNAQDASGRLPDYINDRYAYWAFTKPPVHGWTFTQLRAAAPDFYTAERMRQVLAWLSAQAGFWLDGLNWHGLPAYRHGNDAGWDNATCFAEGGPLVSPDLANFLVLQLDEIAELHLALGERDAAGAAKARADVLCAALCRELWVGEGFAARLQVDGRIVQTGQSLLLFLPLLLGKRLPQAQRESLLKNLFGKSYLTRHGLATEATDSPLYRANGYWRGPIWAPTIALFVDALRRCAAPDQAAEIACRYLALCNANGMAENHDALSGQGLHDPAFAWTSAVFLTLGASLLT